MKIIYPNSGVLFSASSELSSAPAANITESHANNPWYADIADASPSITIEVEAGEAVLVYKIQAEAVTITVKTPADSVIKAETHDLMADTEFGVARHIDHIWMEYPEQTAHKITVDLTKGSYAYAGIGLIYAGPVLGTFTNPKYGNISMDLEDHSEIISLSGGVVHPLLDNVQRIHPASLEVHTDAEFTALIRLGKMIGTSRPFACKMVDEYAYPEEMLVYARFDPPPKGQPTKYRQNSISFSLKEFL